MARVVAIPPGEFSAPSFLPAALLSLHVGDIELVQTRDPEKLAKAFAVIEVGDVRDHSNNRFVSTGADHESVVSRRASKIPLSAAGLVWEMFGDKIITEKFSLKEASDIQYVWNKISETMVEAVDACFHGVPSCSCTEFKFFSMTSFSNLISTLDPVWQNKSKRADQASLQKALKLTVDSVQQSIKSIRDEILPAVNVMKEAFDARLQDHPSGKILFLSHFVPWRSHLYDLEAELEVGECIDWVCFQDDRNLQWRGTAVAVKGNRFANRALIHESLRGLRDDELVQKSGIQGATFVHHSGFTCGATSREGILALFDFKG